MMMIRIIAEHQPNSYDHIHYDQKPFAVLQQKVKKVMHGCNYDTVLISKGDTPLSNQELELIDVL